MGRGIKCYSKVKCEKCNILGILQVFYNSQGIIKYGRIRHYLGMKDNKPKFRYCKQSIEYIKRVLDDLNNIGQSKQNNDPKLSNKSSITENTRGSGLVWSRIPAWGAGGPGFKSQLPHQMF